jgi:hypothetical protein
MNDQFIRVEKVEQPPDRYVTYVTMELLGVRADGQMEVRGSIVLPEYCFKYLAGTDPVAGSEYEIAMSPRGQSR